MTEVAEDWQAYHLYYHECPQTVLREFVVPTVRQLEARELVRQWFFVFYDLGGPHVRWRLEVTESEVVGRLIEKEFELFIGSCPSGKSMSSSTIRSINEHLIASDPFESDDTVYPDNHIRYVPFVPEVERYGGDALLAESLRLFTASSHIAGDYYDEYHQAPKTRQYPAILMLLFQMALGMASSLEDLQSTVQYAVMSWGDRFDTMVQKADRVFATNEHIFVNLLVRSLGREDVSPEDRFEPHGPFMAARRFRDRLRGDQSSLPSVLSSSHLHMTANRLGIKNPEEVYLGQLIDRALTVLKPDVVQRLETLLDP